MSAYKRNATVRQVCAVKLTERDSARAPCLQKDLKVTVSCRGSHKDHYSFKHAAADKSVCAMTQLFTRNLRALIEDWA